MPARPQSVDAPAGRGFNQKPLWRRYMLGGMQTQKRVLHSVLGIYNAAEHSIGDGHHSWPQVVQIGVQDHLLCS
jgi:hypothetical protein